MAMNNSGVYQIRLMVDKKSRITIGKLGTFTFPEGQYVYTGRAGKNLTQRISRHKRLDKKCFWHIDYILSNKHVRILDINVVSSRSDDECVENQKLLKECASIVVKGFGATDCKSNCGSHLLFLAGPS
jgi:Uri superfamily endonuclease